MLATPVPIDGQVVDAANGPRAAVAVDKLFLLVNRCQDSALRSEQRLRLLLHVENMYGAESAMANAIQVPPEAMRYIKNT